MNYNSNPKETSDERAELTKKFDKNAFQNTSNPLFARPQPTPLEDQRKLPTSSFKNKLKACQALKAQGTAMFIPGSNAATEFLTRPSNNAFESQNTGSIPFIPNTTATLVSVEPTSLEAQKEEVPKSSLKSKLRLSYSSFNASSPLDNEKGSAPSNSKPSNQQ